MSFSSFSSFSMSRHGHFLASHRSFPVPYTVLTVPYRSFPRHGDGLRPGGGSAAALPAAGRPAGGLRGRVGGLGGVHDGLLCPQNPDLPICGRGIHWCVPCQLLRVCRILSDFGK